MPLDKLLAFTKKVGDLADKPNATMTAAEVKAHFDAAPDELRLAFNTLIDDLLKTVDGDSGADNIGVTPIAELTGDSVQELLEALKGLDDSNKTYLLSQIQGATLGQIPDGTITDIKLSNNPTNIKQTVTTHLANNVLHVTQADKDKWNATDTAKFKKGNATYTDNDTSQTFADAFCTINSLVTITITSATPPKGVWSVDSAAGSFTITSTVAEDNDITFDYFIQKAVG